MEEGFFVFSENEVVPIGFSSFAYNGKKSQNKMITLDDLRLVELVDILELGVRGTDENKYDKEDFEHFKNIAEAYLGKGKT